MTTIKELWTLVDDLARENAGETEAEGYTREDRLEHSDAWGYFVHQSALTLIDSLNGRECGNYGLKKPITSVQAAKLRKLSQENYGQFGRNPSLPPGTRGA
jgi:hypothetical protein